MSEFSASKKQLDKMNRQHKSLKAGIWYTVSSFLVKSISFIATPIFTRLMTQEEVGSFSIASTWISILAVTITLNLYDTVMIAKYDYPDEWDKYLSTMVILGSGTAATFYFVICLFPSLFTNFIGIPMYTLHIMFIYVIFSPCMEILLTKFRVEMKYLPTTAISLISSLISSITAVILVVRMENGFEGRFIGTYFPLISINFGIFLVFIIRGRCFRWKYCKYALPIALPLMVHYLSGSILAFSDRIMIQKICSAEEVAFYSIAYSCGYLVNVLRNSMNSAWDPWVFEQINSHMVDKIKKYSYYYLLFFSLICLVVIIFAPEVLWVMGGKSYVEAKYVIPPVVAGYMFTMIYSLYSCVERYYKKQKWFALFSVISAATNVILNLIFIPLFGYIAAAYTTLVCCTISCILHYWNVQRIGKDNLYDTKFNMILLFCCVGSILLMNVLYAHNVIRYCFVIILIILLFYFARKHRDELRTVIIMLKKGD